MRLYLVIALLVTAPMLFLSAGFVDAQEVQKSQRIFRAGAASVDITPAQAQSIIAGGFLEVKASTITDRLYARAIVMSDGETELAIAVVDTCMMPLPLIEKSRQLAEQQCGLPAGHITISATHTHTAPAAMGCLGTRLDSEYAKLLPMKIADAIAAAYSKMQPARIGWASIDDWQHTHNRRWIRKSEALIVDPFGKATGRAHMHPGYLSRDVIGPSGPVDPELSVVSIQSKSGVPLALLANYSQHYFGSKPVSADYYGHFAKAMAERLNQSGEGNGPFVCAMSQGTSGDLMWMDYGSPAQKISLEQYADGVADYAYKAWQQVEYRDWVKLGSVERRLSLDYRVPDQQRLEWARPIAAKIENETPKSLQEVYAQESLILHERQRTEILLQALRIGELTIATLPNEVYALTGLKLKDRSPFESHFNIELAGGGDGYIPPPEQHQLGGYTTWPARTAGLEVQAEPKIVEALVSALEEVTGKTRRAVTDQHGAYASAVMELKPLGYWRLNESEGRLAASTVADAPVAKLHGGFAWYLPGAGSGSGIGDEEHLKRSAFSGPTQINRAVHLADGAIRIDDLTLSDAFSIGVWFWLGQSSGASQRQGTILKLPDGQSLIAAQDAQHRVRLFWHSPSGERIGNASDEPIGMADDWHMVMLVTQGDQCKLFVDGKPASSSLTISRDIKTVNASLEFGDKLQGKLDEIALFPSALEPDAIASLWQVSEMAVEHDRSERRRQRSSVTDAIDGRSPGAVPIKFADDSEKTKSLRPVESKPGDGPSSQPLSPEQSLSALHVARGFRAELVAAEPLVLDPVAFDWDVQGRLWVVEMADYPLGMDGKGQAGGRVRVLQDEDGDGRYDSSHLFAEGLNFPNGIITWRDGVLVTAAPQILYLRDTDGDGRCDVQENLFEGFQQGNQQLRLNGLRYGLDHWVYCANGGHHANYGLDTKVTSRRLGQSFAIGSRDFRIQPDTGQLALESGPSQYGRNRDAWGHWFGVQNAKPLWQYVVPGRYLARNPHVPAAAPIHFVLPPGSPPVYPASQLEKRFHSFNESGHFTSACSGMIYNDVLLFGKSSQSNCFTCEPFHNLVQHNVLTDDGVTYRASRPVGEGKFDFFASEDRWSRPVMVRTGPDGGLWVADMYRYMIEHPDWLPPVGKQELLPHYRLGDDRGRIYRIVPENTVPENTAQRRAWPFPDTQVATLVSAMDSTNDWQRDKAQQWVIWSSERDEDRAAALPLLEQLARSSQIPEARVQALATLSVLHSLPNRLLLSALEDPVYHVREVALQWCEGRDDSDVLQAMTRMVTDTNDKVCLQLALSLGEMKHESAGDSLVLLAERYHANSIMRTAIMSSALAHAQRFASGLSRSEPEVRRAFSEPLLRQSIGSGDLALIASMFQNALQNDPSQRLQAVDELLLVLQRLGTDLDKLGGTQSPDALGEVRRSVNELAQQLSHQMNDASQPLTDRVTAARVLSRLPNHRNAALSQIGQWLTPQVAPELQIALLQLLGQSNDPQVPQLLAGAWSNFTPALRAQALDVWTSRATSTADLLARIERGEVAASSLDLTQRTLLLRYPDAKLAARAKSILGDGGVRIERQAILDKYQTVISQRGDAERGREVYRRACASCHRRGDAGFDVGPNLASVLSHSKEKLLRNILDPNADIQPGFQAYTCLLDSGEILSGLLAGETSTSLSIKAAGGQLRTVTRGEIEKLQNLNISLMPEGLEASISVAEMGDLLEYLTTPSQP